MRRYRYFFIITFSFLLFHSISYGKSSNAWLAKPTIKPYGYVDVFFATTVHKPDYNYLELIFANYNKLHEFNINQAVLGGKVIAEKYRATLSFHYGTYLADAYAQESSHLKYIRDAQVGISLNKKNTLWIDAGIFPAPYTRENTMPAKNWTITLPIISALSPFYQTGVRLQYLYKKNWEFDFWIVNGWGRIARLPDNTLPSFTASTVYTHKKGLLSYNFFLGTDFPDSTRRMRYFNDINGYWDVTNKLSLGFSFELGFQQAAPKSTRYQSWIGSEFLIRYAFLQQLFTTFRIEYYGDKYGILVPDLKNNTIGVTTGGPSFNIDYKPIDNLSLRLEVKYLHGAQAIFKEATGFIRDRTTGTASISYVF